MQCKKCSNNSSIVLKNKGCYCKDCCIENINHKFRARIGKYRLFSKDSHNVLVCLSGGAGSTVLLDLVSNAVSMVNNKKLKIDPQFLHIIDNTTNVEQNIAIAEVLIEKCKKYKNNIKFVFLSEFLHSSSKHIATNCIPPRNLNLENECEKHLQNLSSATVKHDFKQRAKRNMIFKLANQLNCNYIFTGETTKIVAENLLTSIVLGRGSQIENEVGFCDQRHGFVKLLRPMCDITEEEVYHYIAIKDIGPSFHTAPKINSLQSVLEAYVTDLQENSEATISTMCRIADKIGMHDNEIHGKKCILCQSYLKEDESNMTAHQATNFSTIVSCKALDQNTNNLEENSTAASEELCYSCSRNYSTENSSTEMLINLLLL